MSYLLGDYLIEAMGITTTEDEVRLVMQDDMPPDCVVLFMRKPVWEKMKRALLEESKK